MAVQVLEIPIVQGGGSFRPSAVLEGQEYLYNIHFNQRNPSYYVTLELNGEIILRETKIVAGYNLLDSAISAEKLSGALYLYDKTLKTPVGNDPGINDLGNNIILVYEEAA